MASGSCTCSSGEGGASRSRPLKHAEGPGVTDVLFGDAHPTGKLPHSWPRSMSQIPINYGDATYDPLYAFGYGLTY